MGEARWEKQEVRKGYRHCEWSEAIQVIVAAPESKPLDCRVAPLLAVTGVGSRS